MNDLPPPLGLCQWYLYLFMALLLVCMVANPLMDLGKEIWAFFKIPRRKKKVQ
jgi:hypothetical protein